MSTSKKTGIQDKVKQDKPAFVKLDGAEKSSLEGVNKAYDEYRVIPHRTQGNRLRYENVDTNTSVRNQFTREDYEYFRPDDAIPKKQKEIISYCMQAYKKVGLIRNVIDLMADFGSQGVKIVHPNPRIQKFFRGWFKRVGGQEVSERFLNLLYRAGNVIVKRSTIKITLSDVKEMQATTGDNVLVPDMEKVAPLKPLKKVIPGKYVFLSPLSLEVIGGELSQFVGTPEYEIKISAKLKRAITNPKTKAEKELIDKIPEEIVKAAKNNQKTVPLDSKKLRVYHYKKDDWEVWADPMVYAILDDLMLLEKMKLADLAALDGAISQVRLWRLGSLEHEIFPTDAAVSKLADILMSNPGGGAFDLIWGPELDFKESGTNVHQFLGSTKYDPVLNGIYAGLGVPPTLTGAATASGFTNNYISLKTLVQRLEYGRQILRDFWEKELNLVQKAMGFRFPAQVVFDRMVLSDEASEKALLIQLADRNIISHETLLERYGELAELEKLRNTKEEKDRNKNNRVPKAGPWHSPEKEHEMQKIALQRGLVTPSEVGLELDERKDGEQSPQDDLRDSMNKRQEKVDSPPKGEPEQGRPKNSKDSSKRDQRSPKPIGGSDFINKTMWAKVAQAKISEIVTPAILSHYSKKNLRSLSSKEFTSLERLKFMVLCSCDPFIDITPDMIMDKISSKTLSVPAIFDKAYGEFIASFISNNRKDPTVEDLRSIQLSVYALQK